MHSQGRGGADADRGRADGWPDAAEKPFQVPGIDIMPGVDYSCWHNGRIEERGVLPTLDVPAERALGVALEVVPW